jgi:hypothetical protein
MKKNVKEKLVEIDNFWKENQDLEKLISKELKETGKNYVDCLSTGRLAYEFGDTKTNHVVYLRVGFKSEKSLDAMDGKKKVLCAIGFDKYHYSSEEGYKFKRIVTPFKKLPIFTQAAIFQTAFGNFSYPMNYGNCYKEFVKTCSNLNKLEPDFKECFFLDTYLGGNEVTLQKIKFSEWDTIGRYKFTFENGKTATLDEEDMYRISHGDICHWGFDYAMALNKEQLIECLTDSAKNKLKEL